MDIFPQVEPRHRVEEDHPRCRWQPSRRRQPRGHAQSPAPGRSQTASHRDVRENRRTFWFRLYVGTAAFGCSPSDARLVFVPALPYFNLAPIGTSSRKLASTGLPPSSDAATIIPLDSSPRIFLGARFATMTTFLPTSVSGA